MLHQQQIAAGSLLVASVAFAGAFLLTLPARAQTPILQQGDAVVTGFSGVVVPDIAFPAGTNPLDKILIDPNGASAQVFRVQPQLPLQGQLLPPAAFQIKAKDVGQVFGIAFDDAPVHNVYLGASSAYGLQIVTPDTDRDGRPERSKHGAPNASWMPGQFGSGGGPGSIYKVDGRSGAATLFATLPNSGPGIGQIAFDAAHHQFFASNLDNGLIYRIGMDGLVRDSFDHGVNGRPAEKLAAVPDDGVVLDLKNSDFDIENPDTWGFTPDERRIDGLAVFNARLYYAATEGPQIWSVAINADGSFGSDARREIDPSTLPSQNAITHISFSADGAIYLAQRGDQRGAYDYTVFAEPGNSFVVRYRRDPANAAAWLPTPDFYAVGADAPFRGASGGVDIGSSQAGGRCDLVWSTGDALKHFTASGVAGVINGAQANSVDAVVPDNAPPIQINLLDYSHTADDPTALGHIGDIALWRNCSGSGPTAVAQNPPGAQAPAPFPPGGMPSPPPGVDLFPPPESAPPPPPGGSSSGPHLTISKKAGLCAFKVGVLCGYGVTVTNDGSAPYPGPITIEEAPGAAGMGVTAGGAGWTCDPAAAKISCAHPGPLAPGQSLQLTVLVGTPVFAPGGSCSVPNTATLAFGESASATATIPPASGCNPAIPPTPPPMGGTPPPPPTAGTPPPPPGATSPTPPGGATPPPTGGSPSTPAPTPKPPSANLQIQKEAVGCTYGSADEMVICTFNITIVNNGPGDYIGPVQFKEDMSQIVGATDAGSNTVPGTGGGCLPSTGFQQWDCGTSFPSGDPLKPGKPSTFTFTVSMPGKVVKEQNGCKLINSASLMFPPGSAANSNTGSISANVDAGPCAKIPGNNNNLKVTKTGSGCVKDSSGAYNCDFEIVVKNVGPDPLANEQTYSNLTIQDTTNGPFGIALTGTANIFPWQCAPSIGVIACSLSSTTLPGGDDVRLHLTVTVTALQVAQGYCIVQNTAVMTNPGLGALNSDGSDDFSGPVSAHIDDPKCRHHFKSVLHPAQFMSGHITLGTSCSPGYSFRTETYRCVPRFPPVATNQNCTPGYHFDRDSQRCLPGIAPSGAAPTGCGPHEQLKGGACQCDPGLFRLGAGGTCIPRPGPDSPKQPQCGAYQQFFPDRGCMCEPSFRQVSPTSCTCDGYISAGVCIKRPQCGTHQHVVAGGTCVCDDGYVMSRGSCVVREHHEEMHCGAHQHADGQTCACDRGYTKNSSGTCVQEQEQEQERPRERKQAPKSAPQQPRSAPSQQPKFVPPQQPSVPRGRKL